MEKERGTVFGKCVALIYDYIYIYRNTPLNEKTGRRRGPIFARTTVTSFPKLDIKEKEKRPLRV